jgi:uncharacterized protein YfcZ (UPF0381/DUF406 family)/exonuclease VII small subunit
VEAHLTLLLVLAIIGIAIGAVTWTKRRSATVHSTLNIDYQQIAARQEEARRARENAERQRSLAEQERYRLEINELNDKSIHAFEAAVQTLEAAEQHLDQAEKDFDERAFAPFWNSVERAAAALGSFHENVSLIKANSAKYVQLAKNCRDSIESFAVSIGSPLKLKLATATSDRLNDIVRQAQRNFEFSMIYEQRKTNQVLLAGFKSLAQALEEMTWRITSSVDELATSVYDMTTTLSNSMHETSNSMHEISNSMHEIQGHMAKSIDHTARLASAAEIQLREAPARAAREQKALEMLDNIQRRRYPSIFHGGLR